MKKIIILGIIIITSCMSDKNKVEIDKNNFEIEFSDIKYVSDSLFDKVYKVNNPENYTLFNIEPNTIHIVKTDSSVIKRMIFNIDSEDYSNILSNIYKKHLEPNIFVNFKETNFENTETMKWVKEDIDTVHFSYKKLEQYNLLGWKIDGYNILIKNKNLKNINIEVIRTNTLADTVL
jgi:hypothetical protein